jgi:inosine-uridine nucleoside N-ribohydrolase
MTTRIRHLIRASTLVTALLTVAACGAVVPSSPSPAAASAAPATLPTATLPTATLPTASPAAASPRPVLVDTDLGSDDILALAVLLRDPAVDVRAITVDGTGLVHCEHGMRNLRRLLGALGVTDLPIGCGGEVAGRGGREFPLEWRAGADFLYGMDLPPVAGSEGGTPAPTLIADTIRKSPSPLTIVALGPWTNLAAAFAADPSLAPMVAGIHAMAGAVDVPGNVELGATKAADGVEWNVGADPGPFAAVMVLDIPVTLVPLDATNDIPVPADIVAQLEPDHTAAGADIMYELYARNPYLSTPGNFLWDPLAALTLTVPDLATWADAAVTVTTTGTQAGRIVRADGGRAIRFASGADAGRSYAALLAALRRGAPRPQPFSIVGTLAVRWDGTACRIEGRPPTTEGLTRVELANTSAATVAVLMAGVAAPKTWTDALALLHSIDLGDPGLQVPDWVIQIPGSLGAEAGRTASAFVTLPAAEVGVICGTGEWPKLDFFDAGSFPVGN